MKSLVSLTIVVAMLAGCDFAAGPHIYVHAVAHAAPPSDSTVITGLTSADTAAALALVERVLIAHGFHRDRRFHEPELLVAYTGEFRSDGSTPLCYIYQRAQHGAI